MQTKIEIIIPQVSLRYFYRDDDQRMELEEGIRKNNIASFPEFFNTIATPNCPALKINFRFIRSNDFQKYFKKSILEKISNDVRGAYSFSVQIENQEIPKSDFSHIMGDELNLIIKTQPKIQAFLIALQLAIPGFVNFEAKDVLTTVKSPIAQKMLQYLYTSMKSDLSMMYVYNKYDSTWPKLQDLPVTSVWKWVEAKLDNSLSSTATDRALFAFTLLHNHNSGRVELSTQLFYSMMGIESLYCENSSNIISQIRERVKLVLGEPTGYKNKMNNMYNCRSKFIHGSLNMPNLISWNSTSQNLNASEFDGIETSAYLSIAILTATLQWLIINQKSELTFKTLLIDT
jgi:hypothetical protein